jgi:hypothetical protein
MYHNSVAEPNMNVETECNILGYPGLTYLARCNSHNTEEIPT